MDLETDHEPGQPRTKRGTNPWLGCEFSAEAPPIVAGIAILLAIALLPVLGIAFVRRGGKRRRATDDIAGE